VLTYLVYHKSVFLALLALLDVVGGFLLHYGPIITRSNEASDEGSVSSMGTIVAFVYFLEDVSCLALP